MSDAVRRTSDVNECDERPTISGDVAVNIGGDCTVSCNCSTFSIPRVQLVIDDAKTENGALQLLRQIRPEWNAEDIEYSVS